MKQQAVTANIGGIKCDNPACDFRDNSVSYTDYKEWVNRPCPKCGANLLTRKDYLMCKVMMSMANALNAVVKVPEDYDGNDEVKVSVNMNGVDAPTFRIEPADTFNFDKNAESLPILNEINRKWLKDELDKANTRGMIKDIADVSADTLKVLLYGYGFTFSDLARYFYCTEFEVKNICREKEINDYTAKQLFQTKDNQIYDVKLLYNDCVEQIKNEA